MSLARWLCWMLLLAAPAALACDLPHRHAGTAKVGNTPTAFWAGPSMSGAWFDPARDGEGVIVQFLADGRALAIWFTYPAAGEPGEQTWLLAQDGVVEGDTLRFAAVIRPQGRALARPSIPLPCAWSPGARWNCATPSAARRS